MQPDLMLNLCSFHGPRLVYTMYMNPVKKLKYCLTVLQQQFREINFPRKKHNLSKEPVLVRLLVEFPSVLVLESTFKTIRYKLYVKCCEEMVGSKTTSLRVS